MSAPPEDPGLFEAPLATPIAIESGLLGPGEASTATCVKLAVAMFLHHFSVASWIVTLGSYIKANSGGAGAAIFSAGFVGSAYGAQSIAATVTSVFTGFLADRWFATERMMCTLHVLAAGCLYLATMADSEGAFYAALMIYFLLFMPTLALVASIALHHLDRPAKQFPVVRACGTAGWMAAGFFVGWVWPRLTGNVIETTATPMKIGLCIELVTAAWCLSLPHTPPLGRGAAAPRASFRKSQTWQLLGRREFAVVLLVSFLALVPTQFYSAYGNVFFNAMGVRYAAAKMALGQFTEVIFMLLLPVAVARLGAKRTVAVGMLAWVLRYVLLAAGAQSTSGRNALLYGAIFLHGASVAFVYIALQLEVDRLASRRMKATAQGLVQVAMQGLGCFVGAELAGVAGARWLSAPWDGPSAAAGWQSFWLAPAWMAAMVLILVLTLLPADKGVISGKR